MADLDKLLIFDLDGTLVDSNRDLVPALNNAIKPVGVKEVSLDDVGHVVGQGALKMIEKAFLQDEKEIDFGGDLHKSLLKKFLAYYESHIADHTVFYPSVLKSLDHLSAEGWKLAICTNKFEHLARKLLLELGEIERFCVITGGDTFEIKKPDPNHLRKTARLADISIDRCVMVGDSNNDIAAALAVPMPVIAVDFGYSEAPVVTYNPTKIISHFDELPQAVEDVSRFN